VTNHIVSNQVRKGFLVPSKIVPAVTEGCLWHAEHRNSLRVVSHASLPPQPGQRKPDPHRSRLM
jgi:hypothetical protein